MSNSDSQSVNHIKVSARKVCDDTHVKDSIYEIAETYFEQRYELEQSLQQATEQHGDTDDQASDSNSKQAYLAAQNALEQFDNDDNEERLSRLSKITHVIDTIIDSCKDDSGSISYSKIAKQLAVLFLSTEPSHIHFRKINAQNKPLYRGLITLLLVENALKSNLIQNRYIVEMFGESETILDGRFKDNVLIPLLLVSMCCDIGHCHPKLKIMLHGENNELDPDRLFNAEQRGQLIKENYRHVTQFMVSGLGLQNYSGNSKEERSSFDEAQKQKLLFVRTLLKSMLKPENGVGNLIKIPQIYTSIILNTKSSLSTENIPRVFQLLTKHAESGQLSMPLVQLLHSVVGDFPMGYGIAYIPKDAGNSSLNQYEYAVVTTLFPESPNQPICRSTTRNMTFHSSHSELHVSTEFNLYFPEAREKLKTMSKKRLEEILQKLWANFETRPELAQILPKYWHPYEYFGNTKYQNLWNKVDRVSN